MITPSPSFEANQAPMRSGVAARRPSVPIIKLDNVEIAMKQSVDTASVLPSTPSTLDNPLAPIIKMKRIITPPESPKPTKSFQKGADSSYFPPRVDSLTPAPATQLPVSDDETPLVAVIGVGYVGIHLVEAFAKHYSVVAFDVSDARLATVGEELSYLDTIKYTSNPRDLKPATHFLISVPTLLQADKSINTSYVQSAISTLARYARPNATVVMESSVAVGMTRELLTPLMQSRGLRAGMSPERVDPGRTEPAFEEIPKVISGLDDITPGSLESIQKLYSKVFQRTLPVSKPEVAEMTKLYENCQRMMAIAYVNEMADACSTLGIDAFEVANAAASKPFGYLPMYPSLGVGGHCIPVNPYYLLSNCDFPLLQEAARRMNERPGAVGDRLLAQLNKDHAGKFLSQKARVLVVGAGFKKGQSLTTMSPGVELMRCLLDRHDVHVEFADPLVGEEVLPWLPKLADEDWNKQTLETFDLIVVAVRQEGIDFSVLDKLEGVKVEVLAQ